MPEPILYRIRLPSPVPEMLRCQTEMLDAGMPMRVIFNMHWFFVLYFITCMFFVKNQYWQKRPNISLEAGHFLLSQLPRGQFSRERKSSPTITTASQVKMQNKTKITKMESPTSYRDNFLHFSHNSYHNFEIVGIWSGPHCKKLGVNSLVSLSHSFCTFIFLSQYIHSYNHSIISFAEAHPHIFTAAGSVGGTSLGCRVENRTRACLAASQRTTIWPTLHSSLSYVAPSLSFAALWSELSCILSELLCTLSELRCTLSD